MKRKIINISDQRYFISYHLRNVSRVSGSKGLPCFGFHSLVSTNATCLLNISCDSLSCKYLMTASLKNWKQMGSFHLPWCASIWSNILLNKGWIIAMVLWGVSMQITYSTWLEMLQWSYRIRELHSMESDPSAHFIYAIQAGIPGLGFAQILPPSHYYPLILSCNLPSETVKHRYFHHKYPGCCSHFSTPHDEISATVKWLLWSKAHLFSHRVWLSECATFISEPRKLLDVSSFIVH